MVAYLLGILTLFSISGPAPPAEILFASERLLSADTLALPETNYYEILTPLGRLVVRLYNETPVHRDNFKHLVASGLYDGTTFHRVIEGFMIQGGDPNSKDADPSNDGEGGLNYTLPAEFRPYFYHTRGALATARESDQVNPTRSSSSSQFYIVQGTRRDSLFLDEVERRVGEAIQDPDFSYPAWVRAVYQTKGGAPHLDQQYTIFGELVEGFDVLDRIAAATTPRTTSADAPPEQIDRPLENIPMTIRPLPDYPAGE